MNKTHRNTLILKHLGALFNNTLEKKETIILTCIFEGLAVMGFFLLKPFIAWLDPTQGTPQGTPVKDIGWFIISLISMIVFVIFIPMIIGCITGVISLYVYTRNKQTHYMDHLLTATSLLVGIVLSCIFLLFKGAWLHQHGDYGTFPVTPITELIDFNDLNGHYVYSRNITRIVLSIGGMDSDKLSGYIVVTCCQFITVWLCCSHFLWLIIYFARSNAPAFISTSPMKDKDVILIYSETITKNKQQLNSLGFETKLLDSIIDILQERERTIQTSKIKDQIQELEKTLPLLSSSNDDDDNREQLENIDEGDEERVYESCSDGEYSTSIQLI